ncbi:hypothetical protein LSCM1_05752 [Leishmania martiniquensis]|uniref:Uncharacterized protein n=1 Tax=Leishmania martiniquensis TaxID=1580590 RepID=A0A836GHA6_9TRYP|nr:hypothetical protein LSCM1_05752 [Leishmania martiniquensis]
MPQMLSCNVHAGEGVALTQMIEEAGNFCQGGNSENLRNNSASQYCRAAAGALMKPSEALPPAPSSLPRGSTNGCDVFDSACSDSVPSRGKCTAAAVSETSTAVAVVLSPSIVTSLLQERVHSVSRVALLPRDRFLPTPLLNHGAVKAAAAVSTPLDGRAMHVAVLADQAHLLSIARSSLWTSTAWLTSVADVAAVSRLFDKLSSRQQADMLARAHTVAAAAGVATTAMPSAQASAVLVPLTSPALGVLIITNDRTGDGRTLRAASAISEWPSAFASAEAPAEIVDSMSDEADSPHTSRTQAHSPPTTALERLACPYVAGSNGFLEDAAVSAADLQQLPSPNIAVSDTSRLTPASQSAGDERRAQSSLRGHHGTASMPDSQPPPLSDLTRTSTTPLEYPSESALTAGATATPMASRSEPALSATAAPAAQPQGERRGTAQRHVMDSRGPLRGDAQGRPTVPITEPPAAASPLRCAVSDATVYNTMETAPFGAVARSTATDTALEQPAAAHDQNSPSPVLPLPDALETMLPPPTSAAQMALSVPFSGGGALLLDGARQSCSRDAASVCRSSPPVVAAAPQIAASPPVPISLAESSASAMMASSAIRRDADDSALLVQQARLATQNASCEPPSMRHDAFPQSVTARDAVPPATSAEGYALLFTSPLRAAHSAAGRLGGGAFLRDDGTAAPPLEPLMSSGCHAGGVQCAGGGAPDTCPAASVTAELAGCAQTFRDSPPFLTLDTDSQPPQPVGGSVACRAVSEAPTGSGARTLADASTTTEGDVPRRGDTFGYRSTSESGVRAHVLPMPLQAAACQEAGSWREQSPPHASGSCCADAIREPIEETASVATRGTPREKQLSMLRQGNCVDVQLRAEVDGAPILDKASDSTGPFAQEGGRVEREGGGGMMSARSTPRQESRHLSALQSPASRSIAANVVQPLNSIRKESPVPLVSITAPLLPVAACLRLAASSSTSVPPSEGEAPIIRRRRTAPAEEIDTTGTSTRGVPERHRSSTPRSAARTRASLLSIGSAPPISPHAAAMTGIAAAVSTFHTTAAGPPAHFVAPSQALSAKAKRASMSQSSVAMQQAPLSSLMASNSKLLHVVGTTYDAPAAVAAEHLRQPGTPAGCVIGPAHHHTAALSCPPAPDKPLRLHREAVAPQALPTCRSTEACCVDRPCATVVPPRSSPWNAAVSAHGGLPHGGANSPSSPSGASVVSIHERAISASSGTRAPMRTRLEALRTPRSSSHRRCSSCSMGERRAAEHIVLTTLESPSSSPHATRGEQAQAEQRCARMCTNSPPRRPLRCVAHPLPLPVCVEAPSATMSSSASREATPPRMPLDVSDADTGSGAPSIIPGTIGAAGSSVSSPEVSDLLGVLAKWSPTPLAMPTPHLTPQQEATEAAMMPEAVVHKRSTAEASLVAAALASETQTQLLSGRTEAHTRMHSASDAAAPPGKRGGGDACGASAAPAAPPRNGKPGTAAAQKTSHAALLTHAVPAADNLNRLTTAPKGCRHPAVDSRARAVEVPSVASLLAHPPVLRSAAATPSTRDAAATPIMQPVSQKTTATAPAAANVTARHPLPSAMGPSWERMEPLPVGCLAPAAPTLTTPTARAIAQHSVRLQISGTPTAVPHCVPEPSSPLSRVPHPLTPRRASFTSHRPAPLPHPAASGLCCWPLPLITPHQGGKGARHGRGSGAALAVPPTSPIPQRLTCGTVANSPGGEVMAEVSRGTHASDDEWPIPALSCPSSVASGCLQCHRLQRGCRSGLPRSLPFSGVTRDPTPTPVPCQVPERAVCKTLSTEPDGQGRRDAGPTSERDQPAAHQSASSPRLWWRGRRTLTPEQGLRGRRQTHGRGARMEDFPIVLPPRPGMMGGPGQAASPRNCPEISSPAANAAAAGGTEAIGDARVVAATAAPVSATSPPLRPSTILLAPIFGSVGGRAGAPAAGGAALVCATAGQPLHRVAAALPASPSGGAAATEPATAARGRAECVLAEAANYAGNYQRKRRPRSIKSGRPQPSSAFAFQPSMGTDTQSPPRGRGGAGESTGSGLGLLPMAEGSMAGSSAAFVPAAGHTEPCTLCDEGINAAQRDAGKGEGSYRQQRAPRLTRALLDRLQRQYAAADAAASRPHRSRINRSLKGAFIAGWRDDIHHCPHDGNGAYGSPAIPQYRGLSASSREQHVENQAAVLPRRGGTAAHPNAPTSPPLTLHAIAGPAAIDTRVESLLSARPDLAVAPQKALYREQCASPSPDPVAPQLPVRANRGAVLRSPSLKALPLLQPAHHAQPHRSRRILAGQPPPKSTARRWSHASDSVPVAVPEMIFSPETVLTAFPPKVPLEHQEAPVLTAVIHVLPTSRRVPWPPESKGQGGSTQAQSATKACPRRGWSGQSIRNFLRGLRKQRGQRHGGQK